MASELALNAYIILGNTLHLLLSGLSREQAQQMVLETGATRQQLERLYARIEPLTPADILDGLRQIQPEELATLKTASLWCLTHLPPEYDPVFGLPRDAAVRILPHIFAGL